MQSAVFTRRYTALRDRALGAAASICLTFACGDEAPHGEQEPFPLPSTLADCGSSLETRIATSEDSPGLDASYDAALAEWALPACGLGVFRGQCADGKLFLYRNGGFASEIRYFDGGRLVGLVASGDFGVCPSVCPFSEFYGDVEDVRCESPTFEDLCDAPTGAAPRELPFANGQPPGGCGDFR